MGGVRNGGVPDQFVSSSPPAVLAPLRLYSDRYVMAFWYKDAVIYALDVKTFSDSNGDGIGDFPGLIRRLPYLSSLGVTCIWLQPFYPSPGRDDGYDVANYYDVDPRLGTLEEFSEFVQQAVGLGIQVIIDLVVNHTSTEHPWFQAARSDPESAYRDYYIWVDQPPEVERRGSPVFPDDEVSNWSYDEVAGLYYWHWFYRHQPDLNTGNPAVRAEIKKIMAFWLDLGVAGFRIDAAPFLFKRKGLNGSHPEDPAAFLLELREFLTARREDAAFLAETDVSPEELAFFMGRGERMHLLLNFILNNYLFLALADESAEPLREAFQLIPACPDPSQWANFIRNHDELNLAQLDPASRSRVLARFAPEEDARIFERGIRRRLPPMLDGSRPWSELVFSLLFSLRGVPVLRYGQEIGMGDNMTLPGRLSVRTPMQWEDGINAGFSSAAGADLVRPVVADPSYAPAAVNVSEQDSASDSFLTFIRNLIATRKSLPPIAHGLHEILETGNPHVFASRCAHRGQIVITVHNLSSSPQNLVLPIDDGQREQLGEVLSDTTYGPLRSAEFRIEPYGYRWLAGPTLSS